MDRFVKFPLPIDKDKINWYALEMRRGGMQLIEILEKEFSLEMLTSYSTEVSHLNLRESEIDRLLAWINCQCDHVKSAEYLSISKSLAKSFFYSGAGLLAKMYRLIDLTPVVEDEEFESRFTFIDYDVTKIDYGYLVVSNIDPKRWHNGSPDRYERDWMKRYFFYDHEKNQIDRLSELGKDLYNSVHIMEEIVGS
ncbi:hypothetical protein D3C76_01520 [compost metagenome]